MNVFVMMERKKKIICRFGSLCRVLHSAKDPFAERNGHNTRQSWQNGQPENRFSSFAECCDYNTRQRNLKKKFKLCRVPAVLALGKEFKKKIFAECLEWWHSAKKISKKNKSSLPSACRVDARQIIFLKKIKNLCRVPGGLALGKETFQKKIKALCRVPSGLALGKEFKKK